MSETLFFDTNSIDNIDFKKIKNHHDFHFWSSFHRFPEKKFHNHIKRDWVLATADVSADGRLVQWSFWRAFRNAIGAIDESLIPQSLVACYEDSDDEEDIVEEIENDVETS